MSSCPWAFQANRLVGHEFSARLAEHPPQATSPASRKRPSQWPPVLSRRPSSRAGTTRVSFSTRQSPGRRSRADRERGGVRAFLRRSTTSNRASTRVATVLGDQLPRQFIVVLIEFTHFNIEYKHRPPSRVGAIPSCHARPFLAVPIAGDMSPSFSSPYLNHTERQFTIERASEASELLSERILTGPP